MIKIKFLSEFFLFSLYIFVVIHRFLGINNISYNNFAPLRLCASARIKSNKF